MKRGSPFNERYPPTSTPADTDVQIASSLHPPVRYQRGLPLDAGRPPFFQSTLNGRLRRCLSFSPRSENILDCDVGFAFRRLLRRIRRVR